MRLNFFPLVTEMYFSMVKKKFLKVFKSIEESSIYYE